jgi:hypothetical protein
MSKLIGLFDGSRPYAQLRKRTAHAATIGDYELAGVLDREYTPYEFGQRHLSGFGQAAAAATTSYDFCQDGRVREVKDALKYLGNAAASPGLLDLNQLDPAKEARWAQLSDDDLWDDAAGDEYVTFLSRWAPRYMCFSVPLYSVWQGTPHPTTNGLLLLDAAVRYQASFPQSKISAVLRGCGYGAPSDIRLERFEREILGKASEGAEVDLNPSVFTNVVTVPTYNTEQHPIPPPDTNPTRYAEWVVADRTVGDLYTHLGSATSEATRSEALDAIAKARADRDQIAHDIITQTPVPHGNTTLECGTKATFDPVSGRCVPKQSQATITPPPGGAGTNWWVVGGVAALIGMGLLVAQSSTTPGRAR